MNQNEPVEDFARLLGIGKFQDAGVNLGNPAGWEPVKELRILPANIEAANYTWTDQRYYELYLTKLELYANPTVDQSCLLIKHLLNFVATGNAKDLNIVASTKYLWQTMCYDLGIASPFVSVKLDRLKKLKDLVLNPPEKIENDMIKMRWCCSDVRGGAEQVCLVPGANRVELTNEKAQNWYNSLWNMSESNHAIVKQNLVNYMGMYCLIICRLIVKDEHNVESQIAQKLNSKFSQFFRTLSLPVGDEKIIIPDAIPPHEGCYQYLRATLGERQLPETKSLLSLMLYLQCFEEDDPRAELRTGIMKSTCMLALAETGQGLMQWMCEAASTLGISLHLLMTSTYMSAHAGSIQAMANLAVSYFKSDERTWRFARLLDDRVLLEFAVSANPVLAMACAQVVSLNQQGGRDLLGIAQFARFQSRMPSAKKFARALMAHFGASRPLEGLTEDAKRIAMLYNAENQDEDVDMEIDINDLPA